MTRVADAPGSEPRAPEAAPRRVCRSCGRPAGTESRFCAHCGAGIESRADRVARGHAHRAQWRAIRRVIVFYVCYVCTVIPVAWADAAASAQLMMIASGVDAVIILAYAGLTRTRLLPMLLVESDAVRWTAIAVAALPLILAANFSYHAFLERTFEIDSGGTVAFFEDAGHAVWTVVLFVCVMPAVFEEIAFRGVIQSQLRKAAGTREAVVLTAALFAIIHMSVLSGVYLFALGLLLGALRERSRSLLPGMALHFLHNFAVVAAEYNGQ